VSGARQRLISVALAGFIPLFAVAQEGLRDRDPDLSVVKKLAADLQKANLHYGPFYFLSQFRLADAGYSATGEYLPTGDQSGGGLAFSVEAPQRLYFVPSKKSVFTAEVTPGYSFFRGRQPNGQEERDGQFNYRLRGDAHFLFNHLYLNPYATRSDQLRAHVADINTLATSRDGEVGLGGEIKYSSRTSAVFSARYRQSTYPLDRFQPIDPDNANRLVPVFLLDRDERNARLAFHHKTFPLTSLFIAGERSNYSFDNATYKDSSRTWYGGGFLYEAGRSSVRVEAGPAMLDFEDPAQTDFKGVVGNLRAGRTIGRWRWNFTADRDLGFSIYEDNNYFIASRVGLGVERQATRRLTLRANTFAERDDYDVTVRGIDRQDTTSFSSVGFLYTVRWVSAGLDVGYYERSTNYGDPVDDSGIRYVIHLSITP
jgi:hypothetical protein